MTVKTEQQAAGAGRGDPPCAPEQGAPVATPPDTRPHTLAFVLMLLVVVGVVATLPVALVSVIRDADQASRQATLLAGPIGPLPGFNLYMDITNLNDTEGNLTVRVSGHRLCQPDCPDRDRIGFR